MSVSSKDQAVNAGDIAAYYDKNTGKFLALGGSGEVAAIHRAIWAPGVTNKAEAFNYLNQLVAEAIIPCISREPEPTTVLDLGCGVGGTSTWLAKALAVHITGVTISSGQQQLAHKRALASGLDQQCRFLQGDFADMPDIAPVDVAFAIESFVHARNAGSFFAMAARQLKPGGRLIICDDFLASATDHSAASFWVNRFKRGWHLNNLVTALEADAAAGQAGFRLTDTNDLSAYTRPFHPLLLTTLSQLTRVPVPWSYWHNLAGGTALQICLKRGWTRYQVMVWDKET
ncbi:MAG: class I SAM-dependent methyltransferase [Pseudohongiella sp.]|nr:class I SAM-dependent methyltransferase [Pseudohongiella sp.]